MDGIRTHVQKAFGERAQAVGTSFWMLDMDMYVSEGNVLQHPFKVNLRTIHDTPLCEAVWNNSKCRPIDNYYDILVPDFDAGKILWSRYVQKGTLREDLTRDSGHDPKFIHENKRYQRETKHNIDNLTLTRFTSMTTCIIQFTANNQTLVYALNDDSTTNLFLLALITKIQIIDPNRRVSI